MADAAVVPSAAPAWLAERRDRGAARAAALGLPMWKGNPGWEFTDLRGFDPDSYRVASDGDAGALDRAPSLWDGLPDRVRLSQVDGHALGAQSEAVVEGPLVMPLEQAVAEHPDLVEPHFGRIVDTDDDPFGARNDADWRGGAFVYVPRNVRVEAPIVLSAVLDRDRTALNWRVLVVLEEGAEADVWEEQLCADPDAEGLFNCVVELSVGPAARLRYLSAQALNQRAWVFGSQRAEVARDGTLDWVALGFGSRSGRVRLETELSGPGAQGKVTGAYAARGRQHLDYDTTQEHAAPYTTSDLAFRGLLGDRATAVWRGMIKVDRGAQHTDAFQESRNLLLSKRAHADAIPGLEILANDVRCTHAAAIAQIDPEQLFYLRSRGLPQPVATRLVIEGFMHELVERFEGGGVRDALSTVLERHMSDILG